MEKEEKWEGCGEEGEGVEIEKEKKFEKRGRKGRTGNRQRKVRSVVERKMRHRKRKRLNSWRGTAKEKPQKKMDNRKEKDDKQKRKARAPGRFDYVY